MPVALLVHAQLRQLQLGLQFESAPALQRLQPPLQLPLTRVELDPALAFVLEQLDDAVAELEACVDEVTTDLVVEAAC